MNTATFKTVAATTIVALFGAAALVLASVEATPAPQIVKLERVVITGQRAAQLARVEHLPRVVIEGRRADAQQVAQADKRCADAAMC